MENQPIFKTSLFGGFERQSVLNYIFELNNNAKAAQDRLNAQMEEVSAARERLSESIRSLEQQLAAAEQARQSLESELQQERSRQGDTDAMLASLNEEILRQRRIIEAKDAEIQQFGVLREELAAQNAKLQANQVDVDKASAYIGEMVIKTKMDTERILEDANQQARAVVEEAAQSLSQVFDQFSHFREEMDRIEETIEDAVISMQRKFAAIGDTIAASEERIRNFYQPYDLEKEEPEPPEMEAFYGGAANGAELSMEPPSEASFFRGSAD